MKKILLLISIICSLISISCSGNASESKKETAAADSTGRILLAYFSATGNTKAVAERIANMTGGTLFEIVPARPYTEADLDGWNDSARGTRESKDRTTRPEVSSKIDNFAQYDTIYLGFPIWWYTAPTIINTFLEQYDTNGKIIIPFATSGGSEFGDTEKDLRVSAPNAIFKPGRVLNNLTDAQLSAWVDEVK